MADFSFVKDAAGKVCGIWVKSESDTKDQVYLMTLLMRGGVSPDALSGRYRVVPNRVDNRGGCFVMLGSARPPDE